MDELLTPVRTTYLRRKADNEPLLVHASPSTPAHAHAHAHHASISAIDSADHVLSVLKRQPDYDSLSAALCFLVASTRRNQSSPRESSTFNVHVPSPQSAAIVHVLVAEIATNYWTLLQETSSSSPSSDARRLIQCLQSVTGVNAIVGHIKALLLLGSRTSKQGLTRSDVHLHLAIFLDLLATLLEGDDAIWQLWYSSTAHLTDVASRKVQTQSLLSLLASGKVLSLVAEISSVIGEETVPLRARWLIHGIDFSRWVARNVVAWAKAHSDDGFELQSCFDLFQRSLSLGYSETIVTFCINELLLSPDGQRHVFSKVCLHQPQVSKKVINMLLGYLSQRFLDHLELQHATPNETVSAVAGLIHDVVHNDQNRVAQLVGWCCSTSGAGLGNAIGIRRAVVALLAEDKETITSVLEKSLDQFGDQLYIKHTAIMQQQVHTEILLLAAGYVARLSPIKLTMLLRSGTYLRTISNRIASTNARARFLGMCVGEALSLLQDSSAKKLDFHMEETDTEDAQWLKSLTKVADPVGPVESVLRSAPSPSAAKTETSSWQSRSPSELKPKPKPKPKAKTMPVSQPPPRPIVEEVDSSSDESSDDDHLQPMPDQGSDAEDSDDDPTLVRRNKPNPPVYIRDLILFLRDSESCDKQELGIKTAPSLIRRKAHYGTEVSSHAEELARLLVGLQDKFDLDDFEKLRLQSMMSLVVAQPQSMAPWFARTFFEGDYSLSQRTSVLVTLGLSARELAGLETSEYQSSSTFASKRLPPKMEQLHLEPSQQAQSTYPSLSSSSLSLPLPPPPPPSRLKALPPNALTEITTSLTSSFLDPLAAQAADASTGPDALKLETVTARYKSLSRSGKPRPRLRAIPNTTAALLSASFFSPLTAHFQFALRSSKPVVLNPAVLGLYLQTLAIIVNAAGPSTLALPQMTSELWHLLLRVRTHVNGDVGATRAWLVALSVLLEINADNMRTLCQEQSREVVESREWVSGVFERTRGEDGGDENDVKMLAAGVLIKLGQVIETYQALLMGDLIGV
ncbi:hypothetical protein E4U42_002045 [Claviceps africana]|uniref:Telomere length regulation protein conserved domain-containing protein n=1 Tax=Claviceps africana TaxID=83212 RepID=A0A8K0J8H9_9HYPO|nr:hypothetical protein E4U42_002045 [Claviceps africana]